ncbi:MAG: hypothetical protein MUW56_09590 [Chryseobacterium sp.]|uniref:hypothetical protein n=1 Tax=Chryseobacterium sp. TaxID=1871047 RepID=UPI0025BD0905|nr:hypothetical protein [Chryseobacterium sp.]MCJ7933869.1 hypothetical protein [Chryseobacterium sp.]
MMQNKYPQKPGIDFILKQAFFYWNKTLVFQLVFSIFYFGIFLTVLFFFDSRYNILSQYAEAAKYAKDGVEVYSAQLAKIMKSNDGFEKFSWALIGTTIFLYPLNLGFYQIYRKIDLKEKLELGDLLAGYNGLNFFKFIGYYIFWFFVFAYTFQTIILGIIWVFVTLFVAPLMFFTDKRIFEAISLNLKALRMYFLEILVCSIVAVFFKYIGFALFFIGGLFTFPFWNAMIYSLYKTAFSEKR